VFQREDLARVLTQSKQDKKKQLMVLEELNRDVDLFINSFLQEESLEKAKAVELAALIKDNKELDQQLAELAAASHTLSRQIFELSVRRDAKAREYAKICNSIKEAEKDVKVKEIVILDISKRAAERQQQVAEFIKLHEVVKNERNKYMNLIQTSEQSAAEMQEKLGILQNEIDILHSESIAKNSTLDKEHCETLLVTAQRDSARADANRILCQRRERQEVVDQQIAEIDKLNSVISLVEKEMIRVKKMCDPIPLPHRHIVTLCQGTRWLSRSGTTLAFSSSTATTSCVYCTRRATFKSRSCETESMNFFNGRTRCGC
jgi:hypothetical protein